MQEDDGLGRVVGTGEQGEDLRAVGEGRHLGARRDRRGNGRGGGALDVLTRDPAAGSSRFDVCQIDAEFPRPFARRG